MSINPNSDIPPAHHHNQVENAVHNAEHAMNGKLNYGPVFKEINALRHADFHGGKLNSELFKSQVQEMDQRLHHDGYLPNLHIVLDGHNKARLIPDKHRHAGWPADSQASPDQAGRATDFHDRPAQSGHPSDQFAAGTGDKPVELPSASAQQLPDRLEQVRDTIGSSPAEHSKEQNALAIGAAVVKEARQLGLDIKTAARLAYHFVAAGLTETMTNMQDGTLDNREQGDFNHGTPTSFGFFQLHHGGEKTDDVVNGHYVKSEMSSEQAYTPNLATERAFHHFIQQHPDLNSDQSIKNCLIKAQAASDGRYERKFDCHLAQAQKLLADTGFYKMLS